jgi:flagellar biosynthesis protein FliP
MARRHGCVVRRFALHDFMIRQTRKADIILFAEHGQRQQIKRPPRALR